MNKNTSKWYCSMKNITSHNQHTKENIIFQEINHLTDQEQSEKLAEPFAEVPNQYDQHSKDDIKFKPINNNNISHSLKKYRCGTYLHSSKKINQQYNDT